MRDNLEHFGDDALHPLYKQLIFLLSMSVIITNILE